MGMIVCTYTCYSLNVIPFLDVLLYFFLEYPKGKLIGIYHMTERQFDLPIVL